MSSPSDTRSGPRVTVDAGVPAEAIAATAIVVELAGAVRRLDLETDGRFLLGRAEDATLLVEDERVSRRHLCISLRAGRLYAEDLGSRNGTALNGRRLRGERRLRGGDELVAGPVRILAGGPRPPADLLDEGALIDQLDEELERARLFRRPFSLVGVLLDGAPDSIARAVADLVLTCGRADLVGEYADRQLLLLLPERSRAEAAIRASASRALVEACAAGAIVRSATYPESGSTTDELLDAVLHRATPAPSLGGPSPDLVVEDAATREVFDQARKAARSLATILVSGESGVGKEGIAREIHRASPRSAGPFVQLNCAALPESLAEAELFGHERGAFTGADRKRTGLIESAAGGTLFLDEIGELPLTLQAKLLRVLEERRVMPIGTNQEVAVDLRFVAATNRDLEREVRAGRFREDLYFRLSAITLAVPPLRERPNDLRALTKLFVATASRGAGKRAPIVSPGFLSALAAYPWPGNVRELRNVIERAIVLGDDEELAPRDLPARFSAGEPTGDPEGPMKRQIDEVERRSIEAALTETGGNRTHAARKLGVSRRTLIYKLHKHGLIEPD